MAEIREQDQMNDTGAGSATESVGQADQWEIGSMKMGQIADHKVAVVRTESGFHAVDNACPHQGYGLVTGSLDGELLTCQWHNWKFDVRTGTCVIGQEDVACHPVSVVDGEVLVTVNRPSIDEQRTKLWPSLKRGIEADYAGQIARDSVRLLKTGVNPAEIMSAGLVETAAKTDYGLGHELAMAADCLAMAEIRHGEQQALPLVQGLSGLAETTRDRPARSAPTPDPSVVVPEAIEREDVDQAMAGVLGMIETGVEPTVIRHNLIQAASAHHLSYGHGMIYTQKTFEVLDRIGWDHAPNILPHLAARLVWSTREDTLPYMAKAMKQLMPVDLGRLAESEPSADWDPTPHLDAFLDAPAAPIDQAVALVQQGAGIEGLLKLVSLAASRRLLRHDIEVELDLAHDFGWLDITHALTTAQAARWAWRADPGPDTARAALFAVWLLFDSGRAERRRAKQQNNQQGDASGDSAHIGFDPSPTGVIEAEATTQDLGRAVTFGDEASAVALAMAGDPLTVGDTLAEASLADRAGSFIVAAHLIKTTEAARREAAETGTSIPLAAAARFLAAPRLERFVARAVVESVDFVTTGRPPGR